MRVPPSKSITHRALVCAALARGTSVICNPSVCDDTLATVSALEKLGIRIERHEVQPKADQPPAGPGTWHVHGGTFKKPSEKIFCNESGTTYRFLTALTDCLEIPCVFDGKPSLLRRPQRPDPQISSQYLSGLLLVDPTLSIPEDAVSKPYIALTLEMKKKFANGPTEVTIEGCWSSAAFLLALGVLTGKMELEGLNPQTLQADRAIVTILKEMGGNIGWKGDKLIAEKSKLKAIDWDFSQTPDLYPIVAVLATFASEKSNLTGLERLRHKESDRVQAMQRLLAYGSRYHMQVDSGDHRIIMAAAVWGKATGKELKFKHPEAVAKSWPEFWNQLT